MGVSSFGVVSLGITSPSTFEAPSAFTLNFITTDESRPPLNPITSPFAELSKYSLR